MRPLRPRRKRVVSRSFRIPLALDRELEKAARRVQGNKSYLIRQILEQWMADRVALQARVE